MARIIQHIIADGRQLHEPEIVQLTLTQGIRTKNEQVLTITSVLDELQVPVEYCRCRKLVEILNKDRLGCPWPRL
jgi:hypothetical protein